MAAQTTEIPHPEFVIALVDGDAAVRRERQLMLRSENFQVRSYGSGDALLADAAARTSDCIVADREDGGADLLRRLRDEGWRGKAILLCDPMMGVDRAAPAQKQGDTMLPRSIGDRSLLQAILSVLGRIDDTTV